MKKGIIILTVINLLIMGVITSFILSEKKHKPEYSYVIMQDHRPEDINSLMEKDLIIIGEPLDDITEDNTVIDYIDLYQEGYQLIDNFYALRNIKIHKIIKGDYNGDVIQAREQSAGILNGKITSATDYSTLKKGKLYIIFIPYSHEIYFVGNDLRKFNIDNSDPDEDKVIRGAMQLKKAILEKYKDVIEEVLKNKLEKIRLSRGPTLNLIRWL